MMQVQSTRFGTPETVEIPDDAILDFPEGIPGFQDHHAFALIEDERTPALSWLQSLHDANIVFGLIDPEAVVTGYEPALYDQDLACLQLPEDEGTVDLRCILVAWSRERMITANLKAPILLNRQRQLGKQVILSDERYDLRFPVSLLSAESVA
jgi:flagellar assembly factor FliW